MSVGDTRVRARGRIVNGEIVRYMEDDLSILQIELTFQFFHALLPLKREMQMTRLIIKLLDPCSLNFALGYPCAVLLYGTCMTTPSTDSANMHGTK